MKKRRYNFNFVEILLALGVATVGIVALVGVLPIAVKASSEAVADSYAADAADMLFAVLDGRMRTSSAAWSSNAFASARSTDNFTAFDMLEDNPPGVLRTIAANGQKTGADIYEVSDNSHFMYFVSNGDKIDFAADIRVWTETEASKLNFTLVNKNDGVDTIDLNPVDSNQGVREINYVRIFAEVSWPVNAESYSKRSKRVYVREYFRPDNL